MSPTSPEAFFREILLPLAAKVRPALPAGGGFRTPLHPRLGPEDFEPVDPERLAEALRRLWTAQGRTDLLPLAEGLERIARETAMTTGPGGDPPGDPSPFIYAMF